jgi:hypothetical protein
MFSATNTIVLPAEFPRWSTSLGCCHLARVVEYLELIVRKELADMWRGSRRESDTPFQNASPAPIRV